MKQVAREQDKVEKALFHIQAQRFACEQDAQKALKLIEKKLKYHQISSTQYVPHHQYEGKGRPSKDKPIKSTQ